MARHFSDYIVLDAVPEIGHDSSIRFATHRHSAGIMGMPGNNKIPDDRLQERRAVFGAPFLEFRGRLTK